MVSDAELGLETILARTIANLRSGLAGSNSERSKSSDQDIEKPAESSSEHLTLESERTENRLG